MEKNNEFYKGEFDDIIVSIPENTVEMEIKVTVYENSMSTCMTQKFNLKDIEESKQLFWDCVDGEYPRYVFTEKGENWENW